MNTTEFQVTGMTCSHCEKAVFTVVSEIAGVDNVEVNAASGRLVITSREPVADAQVLAAVDEAGYTAVRGR